MKKVETGRFQLELEKNFSPLEGASHLDQGEGLSPWPSCEKGLTLTRLEKGHFCPSTQSHLLGPPAD